MSSFQPNIEAKITSLLDGNIVMRSTAPGGGKLSVVVSNTGAGVLLLAAQGASPSSISLDFGGLLSAGEIAGLRVETAGWTVNPASPVVLTPARDVRLLKGHSLTITLVLGTVSGTAGAYKATLTLANLADAADEQQLCPSTSASIDLLLADRFTPALDFLIESQVDEHVVTRSTGQTHNVLTAHVTNAGSAAIVLAAAGASEAAIAFDFGSLLSRAPAAGATQSELQQAVITAPGWSASLEGSSAQSMWVMRPQSNVPLAAGAEVTFTITLGAVGAASAVGNHEIDISCRYIAAASNPWQLCYEAVGGASVILVDSPQGTGQSLKAQLACAVDPDTVFCWSRNATPISSSVTLTIANTDRDNGLLSVSPRQCNPVFTVVFPTAPRPGTTGAAIPDQRQGELRALTYPDLAKDITIAVKVAQDDQQSSEDSGAASGSPWQEVVPNPNYLTWTVSPADGNDEVLGAGESLQLQFGNIVSPLPASATRIYVLYSGFDGFDDGYLTALLLKEEPKPTVLSFEPADPSIDYGLGTKLRWSTRGADWIEISHVFGGQTVLWSNRVATSGVGIAYPDGEIAIPVAGETLEDTITYSLSLMRDDIVAGATQSTEVARQEAHVTVARPEVAFSVSPDQIAKGGQATLSWKVIGPWALTGRLRDDMNSLPADALKTKAALPASFDKSKLDALAFPPEGELVVEADITTTYTLDLTAATPKPFPILATAVLNVCRPIQQMTASPTGLLPPGTAVTLRWQTEFASSRSLDLPSENPNCLSNIEAAGTHVVHPLRTTTYTLTCKGFDPPSGLQVTIDVKAVDVIDFSMTRQAGPGLVLEWFGELVSFHLSVRYATSARIEQAGTVLWPLPSDQPAFNRDGVATFDVSRVQLFNGAPVSLIAEGPSGPVRRDLPVSFKSGLAINSFTMRKDGQALHFAWSVLSHTGFVKGSLGVAEHTSFPTRQMIDGDEHPIDRLMPGLQPVFSIDTGNGNQEFGTQSSSTDSYDWHGDTSSGFLASHAFYLLVWEQGQSMPMIQIASPG